MEGTDEGFELAARTHAQNIQGCYRELLGAIGELDEVGEIAAALQVDVESAWRVRRLTDAIDPLMAVECIPSATEANAILGNAIGAGFDPMSAELLLASTRAYFGFVERNFGDRKAFETRAAEMVGRDLDAIMLESRRAAYRANVMIAGKRTECSIHVCGIAPGDAAGTVSSFGALGHVGLQRIRPEASALVSRQRFKQSDIRPSTSRPLDPVGAERFRAPLMERFVSANLESSLRWRRDGDFVVAEFDESAIGPSSVFTYISGTAVENYAQSLEDAPLKVRINLATPMKRLVVDALVHEDVPHEPADFRVVPANACTGEWPDKHGPENIAYGCVLEDMGDATARTVSDAWSREDELVDDCLERMGWEPRAMRRYRFEVEYPMLASVTTIRCERGPAADARPGA